MKKAVIFTVLGISLSNFGAAQALLEDVSISTGFESVQGVPSAYIALDDSGPNIKVLAASYRLEHREECGAGDAYGQFGGGQLNFINSVAYVPVDEQSFVQDKIGLVYSVTITDGAQNRELNGVFCR